MQIIVKLARDLEMPPNSDIWKTFLGIILSGSSCILVELCGDVAFA